MSIVFWTVNTTIKSLTRILCRIDETALAKVPQQGPLILVVNHINFLDIPVLYTHLQPRPLTGLIKSETWDNWAMAFLFNLWGGIPLRRGEADLAAYHKALTALQSGKIVAIAPEGTRSGHGSLQHGNAGIVTLALRSHAPLLPVVYYGNENFQRNIVRLRKTDFNITIGCPFYIEPGGVKVTRPVRQVIANEIMYQLALHLPETHRGVYANIENASHNYLRFLEPEIKSPQSSKQPEEFSIVS